jgi:hypothetical protein
LAKAFIEMPEAKTVITANVSELRQRTRSSKRSLRYSGHHEHGQKDHGRDGADPVEMSGGNAVFGAAGRHANQFQRAEVGCHERKTGHPRRNRTPGEEEVRRRFHVAPEGEADADDKACVRKQDGVVNPGEMNRLHISGGWNENWPFEFANQARRRLCRDSLQLSWRGFFTEIPRAATLKLRAAAALADMFILACRPSLRLKQPPA